MITELFLWTTEELNKMINRFLYSLNALPPLKLNRSWKNLKIKINFSNTTKKTMWNKNVVDSKKFQ